MRTQRWAKPGCWACDHALNGALSAWTSHERVLLSVTAKLFAVLSADSIYLHLAGPAEPGLTNSTPSWHS